MSCAHAMSRASIGIFGTTSLTFVVIFEINFSSSYQNAAAIIQAAWRIYQHKKILKASEKEVRKNLLFWAHIF